MDPGERLCVYAISLGGERFAATEAAFRDTSFVDLVRSPGVVLSELPQLAATMLTGSPQFKSGALGCFLAHVIAWEKVAGSADPWALVIEDDVEPCELGRIFGAALPADAEIVWLNRRMDWNPGPAGRARFGVPIAAPARDVLKCKVARREPPGGEGYLLSRIGAGKLLDAVEHDGMHGHVDWRLLRYAITPQDVRSVCGDSWMRTHTILRPDSDRWRWNVVAGYSLSPYLIVERRGRKSFRNELDRSA